MCKKYAPGITEKRLNNRRFRKTEEAIISAFFGDGAFVGTKEMARRAGVARTTFYHHHRTVREIIPDYRKFILRKYSIMMGRLLSKRYVAVRKVYSEMLLFLVRNRKVFEILIKAGEISVVKEMIIRIKPVLLRHMRLSYNADKIFGVYASEITELIYDWSEKSFAEDELAMILDDAMFLTDTSKVRLKGLA